MGRGRRAHRSARAARPRRVHPPRADDLARSDAGLDGDELPSAEGPAYHACFRPITRKWFDEHSGHSKSEHADRIFANYREEGHLEPCKADDEGAETWTMIATGV